MSGMWILCGLLGCVSPPGAESVSVRLVSATPTSLGVPGATVHAAQGDLGGVVWLSDVIGLDRAELVVRVQRDGDWREACRGSFRCYLDGPVDGVWVEAASSGWSPGVLSPDEIGLSLSQDRTDGGWWADETATLSLAAEALPDLAELHLQRQVDGRTEGYDSGTATWGLRSAALEDDTVTLATDADNPRIDHLVLLAGVQPTGWQREDRGSSPGLLPLASASAELLELGRSWAWGDVHAHGDLSHDGCTNPDEGCIADLSTVGMDFFESAVEEGLDFAAMSDHAEWYRWSESGDVDDSVLIWERAQEAVAAAVEDHADFIPLLGYEWSASSPHPDEDGYWLGGHRTVIFEDTEVCELARIAGAPSDTDDSFTKPTDATVMLGGTPYNVRTALELARGMDRAQDICELDGRVLLIPHHPAFSPPGPVDWTNLDNEPTDAHTPVVEIYSEHGSSECLDLDDDYCSWRLKSEADHVEVGSLQQALSQGYQLGFVGGTDSHDGQPGTVEDAPSCTAILDPDSGELMCHDYRGGLTGVMVRGDLDRSGLFDAIFDRSTVASSGPRLQVRAFVRSTDDALALPGSSLDASTADQLVITVEGLVDRTEWDVVAIDLLDPSGDIVDSVEGETLEHDLVVASGEVLYGRLRLYGPDDDEGERLWVSPWFFD